MTKQLVLAQWSRELPATVPATVRRHLHPVHCASRLLKRAICTLEARTALLVMVAAAESCRSPSFGCCAQTVVTLIAARPALGLIGVRHWLRQQQQ